MDKIIENSKLNWIAYCRKSSEAEDKQILSIDAQKRELKELAQRERVEITDLLAESKSAYKTGREGFGKILSMIEKGEVNGIVVYHLSRLARNTADGGRLIYLMDEGKLQAILTPTRTYTNNPDDKFFLQIEFGMSKKSSDDTSTYVKRDIESKLLKGEYPGWAPIGYLNIDKEGRIAGKFFDSKKQIELEEIERPLNRIEQDPMEAPLVRRLFEEAMTGRRNLRELCEFANRLNIKSKRYQRKIGKSTLHGILTNPFYYGVIRLRGEIYQGVHEPIVSKAEFEQVQRILHDRSRPRPKRLNFAFRGLLKCGACGMSIVGTTKTKPSGKSYTYYVCSKRRGNCGQPGVREEELEKQIAEKLKRISISERLWKVSIKLLKESYGHQIETQEKQKAQWLNQRRLVEMKMKRLLDLRIDEELNDEEYKEKRTELLEEKQRLDELVANANQNNTDWLKRAEEFFEYNHLVYKAFRSGSVSEKKAVVAQVGCNLKLKDKELAWEYKKPFTFLVERPVIAKFVGNAVGTSDFALSMQKAVYSEQQMNCWRARPDLNRRSSP